MRLFQRHCHPWKVVNRCMGTLLHWQMCYNTFSISSMFLSCISISWINTCACRLTQLNIFNTSNTHNDRTYIRRSMHTTNYVSLLYRVMSWPAISLLRPCICSLGLKVTAFNRFHWIHNLFSRLIYARMYPRFTVNTSHSNEANKNVKFPSTLWKGRLLQHSNIQFYPTIRNIYSLENGNDIMHYQK